MKGLLSLKLGAGAAIAVIAVGGAFLGFQASSRSASELVQLSDEEKLEILNSGDEAAILELMEAEDALARAKAEKERIEAEQARAEADKRGKDFWAVYDVDEIDLTGFNFDFMESVYEVEQRREISKQTPGTVNFPRVKMASYPPSRFPCGLGYNESEEYLETADELSLPIDTLHLMHIADYIADRAALSTGDCSCATQDVPAEQAYKLAEKIASYYTPGTFEDEDDEKSAAISIGDYFHYLLRDEKREFCGQD